MNSVLVAVLKTNAEIVSNMVDAVNGRVTTSLFPLEDLKIILDIGIRNFSFEPFYTAERSQYYYPLFESSLKSKDIVIHVPFKSKDKFDAHKIMSFPFSADNSFPSVNW